MHASNSAILLSTTYKTPIEVNMKRTDSYRFATFMKQEEPRQKLNSDTSTDIDEVVDNEPQNIKRPVRQSVARVKLRSQKRKSLYRQMNKAKCASVCEANGVVVVDGASFVANRRPHSLDDLTTSSLNHSTTLLNSPKLIQARDVYEQNLLSTSAFKDDALQCIHQQKHQSPITTPVLKRKFINAHTIIDTNSLNCNSELLVENSIVMGSPLHFLLEYQNSRRSLKRKEPSEENQATAEIDRIECKKEATTVEETQEKEENKGAASSYYKDLIGIFLSTIILFSSLLVLEIVSTLLLIENSSENKSSMIAFKLSLFSFNIILIILVSSMLSGTSRRDGKYIRIMKSILLQPNFSLLALTLCILYIYILIMQLISYFHTQLKSHQQQQLFYFNNSKFQIILSILSGISYSLFILALINYLCELSDLRDCCNQQSVVNVVVEKKKRTGDVFHKKYQLTFLCYLVLYQTNLIYLAIVFLFLFYIIGEQAIIEQFANLCLNSISLLKTCPITNLLTLNDYLFDNKNTIYSHIEHVYARFMHTGYENTTLTATSNQSSTQVVQETSRKIFDDVYLLVFSLTLVNFIVSVVFAFMCIGVKKSRRPQVRFSDETTTLVKSSEMLCEAASTHRKEEEYTFCTFHSTLPLMLFHGFIKTFVIFELTKWYSSCFRGPVFLAKSILCYGFSSIASLLILTIVYLILNVKRSVLFALLFVQQFTLLLVLLYWDAKGTDDFMYFSKDFIFITCFAICDIFWYLNNLNNLLFYAINLKSKSPILILFYGYTLYNLGHTIGYILSLYSCFTIKIYLAVVLFLISSLIYIIPEILKNINFDQLLNRAQPKL